jgi:DNA-binding SARP family transcriptional activator
MSQDGRRALEAREPERAARLLHAALDLWRGPTLADVTLQLVESERPRIEMARMDTLQSRIDADLALGHHRRLTAELTHLTSVHPLREGFRAQLITALYRCDQQAEAFAAYYEGYHLLKEELGVDPGPTLKRVHHALIMDDFTGINPYQPAREIVTLRGSVAPAG